MQPPDRLIVRYGQATSAGAKPVNEDVLGFSLPTPDLQRTKGIALVIADGVSTAEAGKEAAEICVQGFLSDYFSTPETWQVKTSAHRVLAALNRWLYGKGHAYRDHEKGYVCALSAVVVKARTAHIFHVGDTRVQLWRDGILEPITRDHTTWLSKDHPVLSRAMGIGLHLEIDYHVVELRNGDRLVLTTDGVHNHVHPATLTAILGHPDMDAACEALLTEAKRQNSPDNLSCQILSLDRLLQPHRNDLLPELARRPFPPPLVPGAILEGYRVERILSESPRSQIYLVEETKNGRRLAMKTPSLNYEDDPAYIERFLLEEWAGKRIHSPHLVHVIERPYNAQWLYYLMEPVEGMTLRAWMEHNRKPEIRQVVNIVQQMIKGVRALHRLEILHQDLKPDNIVLTPDQRVVIIDLGSLRIAGVKELAAAGASIEQLGTRHYAAPEYTLGRAPSNRSDLYSIALITYELLTGGAHPFNEKLAVATTVRDFQRLEYQSAAVRNPLVPKWIDGAIKRALSLDPSERQEALSEFSMELEQPNPAYLESGAEQTLFARKSVHFWQAVSGILALVIVMLAILLAQQ